MSWYFAKRKNGSFCFVGDDKEKTGPVKDVKAHPEIGMMQVNIYLKISCNLLLDPGDTDGDKPYI